MKQRVVIRDLKLHNDPVVTEMVVTGMTVPSGHLIRFVHLDGSVSIINIDSGWSVVATEEDD